MADLPIYPKNQFLGLGREYFQAPEASHSYAKHIDRSPFHYQFEKTKEQKEPSDAMKQGSLVHALILEPHTVLDVFEVAPKLDRRTTAGKVAWATFVEEAKGKTLITEEIQDRAKQMADAVMRHKGARRLLDKVTATEVSIFFDRAGDERKQDFVSCKARLDAIAPSIGAILDIKTTDDASSVEFGKTVANYSYHTQGDWYLHAANLCDPEFENFVIVAVENVAPYGVCCYQIPDHVLDAARALNDLRLERLFNCQATDYWPSYPETIQVLEFPSWGFKSVY